MTDNNEMLDLQVPLDTGYDYCYLCGERLPLEDLAQITVRGESDLYCPTCANVLGHTGNLRMRKD